MMWQARDRCDGWGSCEHVSC